MQARVKGAETVAGLNSTFDRIVGMVVEVDGQVDKIAQAANHETAAATAVSETIRQVATSFARELKRRPAGGGSDARADGNSRNAGRYWSNSSISPSWRRITPLEKAGIGRREQGTECRTSRCNV